MLFTFAKCSNSEIVLLPSRSYGWLGIFAQDLEHKSKIEKFAPCITNTKNGFFFIQAPNIRHRNLTFWDKHVTLWIYWSKEIIIYLTFDSSAKNLDFKCFYLPKEITPRKNNNSNVRPRKGPRQIFYIRKLQKSNVPNVSSFSYLLPGCPTASVEPFLREKLHLPGISYCILLFDLTRGHPEPRNEIGPNLTPTLFFTKTCKTQPEKSTCKTQPEKSMDTNTKSSDTLRCVLSTKTYIRRLTDFVLTYQLTHFQSAQFIIE